MAQSTNIDKLDKIMNYNPIFLFRLTQASLSSGPWSVLWLVSSFLVGLGGNSCVLDTSHSPCWWLPQQLEQQDSEAEDMFDKGRLRCLCDGVEVGVFSLPVSGWGEVSS